MNVPVPYILITAVLMIKSWFEDFDAKNFLKLIEALKTIMDFIITLTALLKILHGKEKKK